MKNLLILIVMMMMMGALLSAEAPADPVKQYLNAPDYTSFRAAVEHLNAQMKPEGDNFRTRLYLHYICDLEATRILDDLMENSASLAPGERFSLANFLLGKEDYKTAVKLYDAINTDLPNWSCPWRHKGEALYKMGDFQSAMSALEQAIATKLDHYDAYIWMAKTQKELGLHKEALANLEKAMTLDPDEEGHDDEEISEEDIQKLFKELRALLQ